MDGRRNEYTRFAWAGGTIFLVVLYVVSVFGSGGKKVLVCYYDRKKSSRLSGGCAITTISTTGPIYAKSSNFYAKLNVEIVLRTN